MAGAAVTDLCETHSHLPREAAIFMARRAPAWVHHTDLEPAAWHGLYLAAATYDPDRGTEFGAWAWHRICGAIRDDMRGIDHVPRRLRVDRHRVTDAAVAITSTGRPATTEQVAAATGLTPARVRDALALAAARPASIDTRIANHVPAQPAPGIERARDAALVAWCWAAIRRLPDQQRQVMEWTYRDGWSRQACADELGVTESRISQIHTTACTTVRDFIAWRLGRPDLPVGPTQAKRRHTYRQAVAADMQKLPRH